MNNQNNVIDKVLTIKKHKGNVICSGIFEGIHHDMTIPIKDFEEFMEYKKNHGYAKSREHFSDKLWFNVLEQFMDKMGIN
ncbi:MAG: hypothetical protein EPN82_09785 [Bacteroidetes bacterium]|nr:MAG: hypothetical protein EPN82_09785 [Bacteroidota bacterium]